MEQTWRWFGPKDKVTLQDARHAGAEGIVTALHEIPVGSPWSIEDICDRQAEITAAGLRWSVVESLDVTEAIKTRINGRQNDIDAFIQSLRNLAAWDLRCRIQLHASVQLDADRSAHPPTAWWVYDELQRNCFRCFRYLHTSTT